MLLQMLGNVKYKMGNLVTFSIIETLTQVVNFDNRSDSRKVPRLNDKSPSRNP